MPAVFKGVSTVLFIFLSFNIFADIPALQTYRRQFFAGDLQEKVLILETAAADSEMADDIGRLYELALEFALNGEYEKDEPFILRLVNISVNGLSDTNHTAGLDVLWRIFLQYIDRDIGVDALLVTGKLGKGDWMTVNILNDFLLEQNRLFRTGASVNYTVISACIEAIIELGDDIFFPALLDLIASDYPEIITYEAYGTFEVIPGNLLQFLLEVIENETPFKKHLAFQIGRDSARLTQTELGQLAELAFEKSFSPDTNGEHIDLENMRYAAALVLTSLKWTRAGPLAVRHFYRVQTDFQHGLVPKERFLEAIALLAATGSYDASLALGLQLGLINNRTRRTGEFDEEITYAIIRALGLTGDGGAFDHLLTAVHLPYPAYIQAAARESINQIRW